MWKRIIVFSLLIQLYLLYNIAESQNFGTNNTKLHRNRNLIEQIKASYRLSLSHQNRLHHGNDNNSFKGNSTVIGNSDILDILKRNDNSYSGTSSGNSNSSSKTIKPPVGSNISQDTQIHNKTMHSHNSNASVANTSIPKNNYYDDGYYVPSNRRHLSRQSRDSSSRSRSVQPSVQDSLDKVARCLHSGPFTSKFTRMFNVLDFRSEIATSENARLHYEELLSKTAKFRGRPFHDLKGYTGPWIENYFIDTFISKPLHFFGGLFPLFVQWTDYEVGMKLNRTDFSKRVDDEMIYDEIRRLLRPDLIYITVAQANNGLRVFQDIRSNGNRINVLVLSAGGEGNVAVPLLKGDLKEPHSFNRSQIQNLLGFFGSVENGPRQRLLMKVADAAKKYNESLVIRKGATWQEDISSTLFNLAPPGWGRTSFRIGEVMQLGRIPVYIYDTLPWLPYEETEFSLERVAIVGKEEDIDRIVHRIVSIAQSAEEVEKYLRAIRRASAVYRYRGVMEQIARFFRDPFGPYGGYLRCSSMQPSGISVLRALPLRS